MTTRSRAPRASSGPTAATEWRTLAKATGNRWAPDTAIIVPPLNDDGRIDNQRRSAQSISAASPSRRRSRSDPDQRRSGDPACPDRGASEGAVCPRRQVAGRSGNILRERCPPDAGERDGEEEGLPAL